MFNISISPELIKMEDGRGNTLIQKTSDVLNKSLYRLITDFSDGIKKQEKYLEQHQELINVM